LTNGCPWTENTIHNAYRYSPHVYRWMMKNGCTQEALDASKRATADGCCSGAVSVAVAPHKTQE
jgi:hypothetical protein